MTKVAEQSVSQVYTLLPNIMDSPMSMELSSLNSALVLEYGCSNWRRSSHVASKLYDNGTKLWTKDLLRNIEAQVADAAQCKTFTVTQIDGKVISIKNPLFGEVSSIWEPRIKYQEYWRLVKSEPGEPSETYLCTYLIEWINMSARRFRGIIKNPEGVFEANRMTWELSESCKLLNHQIVTLLRGSHVASVLCFGLGDMCRRPPEWWTRHLVSSGQSEACFVQDAMLQHSVALTITDACSTATSRARLLAQDPDYNKSTRAILKGAGFSIVGEFGAGGFAEIDDNSVVFSVGVEAPLKQIIADLARPLLVVTTGFSAFNDSEKPWADADSPRTVCMWEQYDKLPFPVAADDDEMMTTLKNVYLYVRKDLRTV